MARVETIVVEKWEADIQYGTEDCTPIAPWKESKCSTCGRLVPYGSAAAHPTGQVTCVIDFETYDEIPRNLNLQMFTEEAPDVSAHILRHTPCLGVQKCTAEFVWQEPLTFESETPIERRNQRCN